MIFTKKHFLFIVIMIFCSTLVFADLPNSQFVQYSPARYYGAVNASSGSYKLPGSFYLDGTATEMAVRSVISQSGIRAPATKLELENAVAKVFEVYETKLSIASNNKLAAVLELKPEYRGLSTTDFGTKSIDDLVSGAKKGIYSQKVASSAAVKSATSATQIPKPVVPTPRQTISYGADGSVLVTQEGGGNFSNIFRTKPSPPVEVSSAASRVKSSVKPTKVPLPDNVWSPGQSGTSASGTYQVGDYTPPEDIYGIGQVDTIDSTKVTKTSKFGKVANYFRHYRPLTWAELTAGKNGVRGYLKGAFGIIGRVFMGVFVTNLVAEASNYVVLNKLGIFSNERNFVMPTIVPSNFSSVKNPVEADTVFIQTRLNNNVFGEDYWPDYFRVNPNSFGNIYYNKSLLESMNDPSAPWWAMGARKQWLSALSLSSSSIEDEIINQDYVIVEAVNLFVFKHKSESESVELVHSAPCQGDSTNNKFLCDMEYVDGLYTQYVAGDKSKEGNYLTLILVKMNPYVLSSQLDSAEIILKKLNCSYNYKLPNEEGSGRVDYCPIYRSIILNENDSFEDDIAGQVLFFRESIKSEGYISKISDYLIKQPAQNVHDLWTSGHEIKATLTALGSVFMAPFNAIAGAFMAKSTQSGILTQIEQIENNKIGTGAMLVGLPIFQEFQIGESTKINQPIEGETIGDGYVIFNVKNINEINAKVGSLANYVENLSMCSDSSCSNIIASGASSSTGKRIYIQGNYLIINGVNVSNKRNLRHYLIWKKESESAMGGFTVGINDSEVKSGVWNKGDIIE